ncbi:Zinc finger protein [Porphyridium purpureum]|uniref:Zinc finger protein n=1 Tax=Porphyridium purpureum TaxID=35688 RepID=A0A5J4YZV2_PORPP|nr:Zinc finger protein [Porphyridium purpureum]|eukprot:POR0846..scf208_2
MTAGTAAFRSVLRILLEEDTLNAWLVQWLRLCDASDSCALPVATPIITEVETGAPSAAASAGVSPSTSAGSVFSSDFEVQQAFDRRMTPQEQACLPYLPRQHELNEAIIWDFDLRHLNEMTFGAIIPVFRDANPSRFVNAVKMLNTSINPLPPGVSLLPGHRVSGFRTRYGTAYISVGSCTDGSIYITLSRLWDNYKWKLETFHTPRIEKDAVLFSYAVIDRPGLCSQNCSPESCVCWRIASSRRTDSELAKPITWNDFAGSSRDHLAAPMLYGSDMHCRAFFGNGQVAFSLIVQSLFRVSSGAMYPSMSHIKFLFLDRLTTASSVRHSLPIELLGGSGSNPGTPFRKRRVEELEHDRDDVQFLGAGPRLEDVQSRMLICDECGKTFCRLGDLSRHRKTIHLGVQSFSCEICHRIFKQLSHLQTHVRVIHEGRRDFACSVCGATFSVVSNWKRHMRTVHDMSDPLVPSKPECAARG